MKVLQFTIPVAHDKTIITQEDLIPHFYPYLHRHEEIQLTWILKGSGTLIADNNMFSFRAGDIICLGGNQPHVFKSDSAYFEASPTLQVHARTIFFHPEGNLSGLFELPEFKKIKAFWQQFRNGFRVPEASQELISTRIQRVHDTGGIPQFLAFIDLLHSLLSLEPLQPLTSGARLSRVNEQEGIRIGYIYDYIMKHYDHDIRLEDIAREAHMTPQAFCRYFKKHTRLTFISFLNEVRINEACKQLADGSFDSISTIAYNCGFNSIANFNRVFRSVTGKSPRAYLRAYGQMEEM